jgi:putative DNA primase/helicase
MLTKTLLKLVAALPPLMDAPPSRPETSPPPPSADAQGTEQACKGLPTIEAKEGDLSVVTDQACAAIQQANEPTPQFFRHGGVLIRLERDDDRQVFLAELTADRMRHVLARIAVWYVLQIDKDGEKMVQRVRLRADVPRDILATPDPPMPILRRIVEVPVFAPDDTLQTIPGYHGGSRTYFSPPPDFTLPPVSDHPSPEEVRQATQLIVDEVLQDFPFIADADRAHAVSLFLQPFCRDLIDGPTPLYVIEAPIEGSGKGLLAEVCLTPAMGRRVGTLAPGRDEEKWRKSITSVLREGDEALWIDNLVHPLDSGTLAAALTAGVWEDCILGQSRTIRVPVRCAWVATANNPLLSRELPRRSIRIRIDPKVDRPWLRQAFHHDDLRAWVHAHRADLVWAALTLVRAWLAAGRPQPVVRPLGSYEAWSRVIGGILRTAEIPGFPGILNEFYEAANTESAAWRSLVAVWWDRYKDTPMTAAELLPLARAFDELEIGGKDEGGQRRSLGKKLAVQRERVIGRYRIVAAGEHVNALRWKLVRASDLSGENSPNSPDSSRSSDNPKPACTNLPEEISISSDAYDARGEFGEFCPAVPESL